MAFLGQDGWKAGLSVLQLGKVEGMENMLDKITKEKTQKQMQVDTLQQANEKLKRKVSECRIERLNSWNSFFFSPH